jgi:2-hydroxymuconate-semialdehyde hydrolase
MNKPAEITTSEVAVGDYKFHLNQAGDPSKPAVIFLHGSGPGATGLSNWEGVLADMGNDYFCLAPDVIGYGDSTHPNPPPQGIIPFTQLRVDTILGLLDVLGIEKASFVGNSMGGMWSLGVVRQAPERVERIVLMGAGGSPLPPGPQIPKLIGFYADPTTESMAAMLEAFVYDPAMFGGELDKVAAERVPRAVRADVQRSHEATFDLTVPWVFSDDDMAAITQDVLIVHGREDQFVTFDSGLYFFQHIPNAHLYGIAKCGHWTQIEHQGRFIAAVRGFLAGEL